MNEKLILEEGLFEPERIMKGIDNAFSDFGFRKELLADGTVCYWGNNRKDDFAYFGTLIISLSHESWFMDYVEKWLWYNSDGEYDENCFRREDILYEFANRRSVM